MQLLDQLKSLITGAKSVDDLVSILEKHVPAPAITNPDTTDTGTTDNGPVMGVNKINGVSINRTRKEANQQAIDVLNRVGNDASKLTEEDKNVLRRYSGIGGTDTSSDTGGHIHEYYTPPEIAAGVWDGLKAMGFTNGNGLEPSAGAGVFNEMKPKGVIMTASEIDKTSSHINQLLHPDDMVLNQPFEKLAADVEDNTFDSCVGNVPFGVTRGATAALDPDPLSQQIKEIDGYFVARVIDKVKPGGLIGLVVPTRIVSGAKNKKLRQIISRKAEFLGAHRLPSGVFSNSGTDVVTDIIFMRKHTEELANILPTLKDNDLKKANVLWDTFINGKWFESAEGKKFIHGDQEIASFQNRIVVNNKNALTNKQLQEKLSHRFESRIDWEAIHAAEPLPIAYADGDQRMINGRWMEMQNGEWQPIRLTNADGKLDPIRYGASSTEDLQQIFSQPTSVLSLTYSQIMAVYSDFPYITKGPVQDFIKLSENVPTEYRSQVIRGSIIGMRIQDLQYGGQQDEMLLEEAKSLVLAECSLYGIPAKNGKLSVLTGRNAAYWNAYSASMDKDGNLSQLLQGKVIKGEVIDFDAKDAAQTVSYLFSVRDLMPVSMDDFLDTYKGDIPVSLEQLAKQEGIAVTPDGMLAPIDRATSGNIVAVKQNLLNAMATETSQALLENYQRQLDEIERKRVRTPVDSIDMNMVSKWVPREYVLEFLKSNGYSGIEYSKTITDEETGEQHEDKEYLGNDGIFSGYTMRDGKKRSNAQEQFERQLENYLNGLPVRSSDAAAASAYKARIKDIEAQFAVFLRQHDDIDKLVDLYNDTFNGFIPVAHSGAPLNLTNISGEIVNFDYQCSEIRRLSEAGTGICGFGTGLGKTATALGLIAYDTQIGRARRTVLVTPNSVKENWYHEVKTFFGHENMANVLFVGVEPIFNKDGSIEQEQILDENGEPRINRNTNQPMYRDKIRELSGKDVKKRLNMIPQSNYNIVVMTKEQFASIPMRPESVGEYVSNMVDMGLLGGKYVAGAQKHRDALKNERYKEKYADTGTEKAQDVPYFEDMGFDKIVADEAHNYRNSYKAGRESSKLAYLPTQSSAQVAVDFSMKGAYLKSKYAGRGVTLLTATPTVNSPTDIFNMLSHVMTPKQWAEYGIVDVDDFVKVFGETEEIPIQKISGEVEVKTALSGFKNLSGLRSIFHKYVNLKTAQDVSESVKVPDLVESQHECEMTKEQADLYEELRQRADALSKTSKEEQDRIIASGGKVDSIFGIIRDMDRVTTDLDLYNKTMTFVIPEKYGKEIDALVADLPKELTLNVTAADKEDESADSEKLTVKPNAQIIPSGNAIKLVVHEAFENEVVSRLSKFKIAENSVSHPMTPKYARLIENLRTGLQDGKQLIFTEEKTQHEKLKRLIVANLGLDPSQIGIINADSVKGKDADMQQASLEKIALAYNEGRHQILICNKKAEVGVNLHHGTSDIHHLTLPWTPASIKQRNGRGARVGASQDKVRVLYYVGKGSFDEFRLKSLKVKADWMHELFTSDADRMANADASNAEEMSLLLAKDQDEREARIKENQKKAIEKVRQAKAVRANIDLNNYIKASFDSRADSTAVTQEAASQKRQLDDLNNEIAQLQKDIADYTDKEQTSYMKDWYVQQRRDANNQLKKAMDNQKIVEAKYRAVARKAERLQKAADQVKRLRPAVESAIKDGLVDAPHSVLDQATNFLTVDGRLFAVGKRYMYHEYPGKHMDRKDYIVEISALNFDYKQATVKTLYASSQYDKEKLGKDSVLSLSMLREEVTYQQSEIDLMNKLTGKVRIHEIAGLLNESQFRQYLKDGKLKISTEANEKYTGNGILLDNDDGTFTNGSYSSYSGIDKAVIDKVVYPDPNNAALKQRLAKWMLENRKEAFNTYGAPVAFYEAIFGANWTQVAESYGSQASDAQINAWAGKQLNNWLATDEGKAALEEATGKSYTMTGALERYCQNNLPLDFDNLSAFKATIKDISTSYEKLVEEARVKFRQDTADKIQAMYSAAANQPEQERADAAVWLYNAIIDSKDVIHSKENVGTPRYDDADPKTRIGIILADLEYLTDQLAYVSTLKYGDFTSSADALRNYVRFHANDIADRILTIKGLKKPAPGNPEAVKEAEAKTEALNSEESTSSGIIFKQNAHAINVPASKTKVRGRWMNRPARNFPIGGLIAVCDPAGKDGKLYAKKEDVKALTSGVFFSVDLTAEFSGAWWFIPAEGVTIADIKKVIGE